MNAADIAAARRLIAEFEGRADGRHNSTRMADRPTELDAPSREVPGHVVVRALGPIAGPGFITFADGTVNEMEGVPYPEFQRFEDYLIRRVTVCLGLAVPCPSFTLRISLA